MQNIPYVDIQRSLNITETWNIFGSDRLFWHLLSIFFIYVLNLVIVVGLV